jgi:hypothetical protein
MLHEAVSDTLHVATTIDTDYKKALPVVQNADGTCALLLPSNAEEGMMVYLFTTDGRLILTIPVEAGTDIVTIPTSGLHPNQLYLIKYTSANAFPRKAHFAKFILRNL